MSTSTNKEYNILDRPQREEEFHNKENTNLFPANIESSRKVEHTFPSVHSIHLISPSTYQPRNIKIKMDDQGEVQDLRNEYSSFVIESYPKRPDGTYMLPPGE